MNGERENGAPSQAPWTRPRGRQRAPTLVLLAVLVVAVVVAAGHRRAGQASILPAKPPPALEQFGANTGRLFNDRTYGPAAIDAQLKALHAAGATVARSDALWELTEPQPPSGNIHHYDWAFDDEVAGALAANGLTWLPIIDYSAPWARSVPGQDHSPPDASEYAAYAAAVAARYGPGGAFWQAHPQLPAHPSDTYEIWNEPDNRLFWFPEPNATDYANLYLRARDAIDAVQPDSRVIVGGLTHPASFLPALVAAAPSLRTQLDGVAIHPYGATPLAVLGAVRAARQALDSLGLTRTPLYVTEFGWTTSPPGALDYVAPRLRPGYIEQTLTQLGHTNCGVAAALLYAWFTPGRRAADAQDWFGISPPGAAATPDTQAFSRGLQAAAAPGAASQLCATG